MEEIVRKFKLEDSKPYSTQIETVYLRMENEEKPLPNNTKYWQVVGALLYIVTVTRPDISEAVNILSRKNETPCENLNLTISIKAAPTLKDYADAEWDRIWAGGITTRKLTTCNLFLLGQNPIQWISKRQSCIAQSSAEAEYVAATKAAQEIIWIIKLLGGLNLL